MRDQTKYKIERIIDSMGRYIHPHEFRWLSKQFRDPYDQRFLCLAIMMSSSLRPKKAVNIYTTEFRNDFTEVQAEDCKPHVRKKDGITIMKVKTVWQPIPQWLTQRIKHYLEYRAMIKTYLGKDPDAKEQLFPGLKEHQLRQFFMKLRKRKGEEAPWLNDLWKIDYHLDKNRKIIWEKKWFRIAPYGARAFFCTGALDVCDGNLVETQGVTGHTELKNLMKYTKALNSRERKIELREKHLDHLNKQLPAPILLGQRKLEKWR